MARVRRIIATGDGYYHVISRITGQQFLLKDKALKEALVDAIDRSAQFSGVSVLSYCIMDNHFHLLCHIPQFDVGTVPNEMVIERVGCLKGQEKMKDFKEHLERLAQKGKMAECEAEIERYRRRMYNLSEFVKTFKEVFSRRFKEKTGYIGQIWTERFKSVLLEDGNAVRRCAAYIELNPVRAGIVSMREEYRWNSVGAARAGDEFAARCVTLRRRLLDGECESEEWMMKRCVQLSAGVILGSVKFVQAALEANQPKLRSSRLKPREVIGEIYASHGYKCVI